VNVTFYFDSATFLELQWREAPYINLPMTDTAGNFSIPLPTSLVLAAGTYWVSVQANMNFSPFGEWGWLDRTVTSNSGAAWQNPNGGFATACTMYGRRGATCGIDPAAPDQIFQIFGWPGGQTPTPTPPGTPSATPSVAPSVTPTASPCSATFSENFDGVVAPALPAGWTTAATGAEVPWVTSTTNPASAPNDAFAPDPTTVGNTELITPTIAVPAAGGVLTFRNLFNMEAPATGTVGYDGMVLRSASLAERTRISLRGWKLRHRRLYANDFDSVYESDRRPHGLECAFGWDDNGTGLYHNIN
jgi:hypothetical protein